MKGIASLRGYQQGGITSPDPDQEERRRRLWQLMAERRDAPPVGEERGGIASLIQSGSGINPLLVARRLASTVVGRRSDTGYVPGVSESIYRAVTPDYEIAGKEQLYDAMSRIISGEPGTLERELRPDPEEDAWRTYLGLPQEYGTFEESGYRPTIGSGEDTRYRDFADPNRVMDTLEARHRHHEKDEQGQRIKFTQEERQRRTLEDLVKSISSYEERYPGKAFHKKENPDQPWGDVLGTYTLDTGEDEKGSYISYYDKWDLGPKIAKYSRAGQPFDIYGRMYYDPETYEYLPNE